MKITEQIIGIMADTSLWHVFFKDFFKLVTYCRRQGRKIQKFTVLKIKICVAVFQHQFSDTKSVFYYSIQLWYQLPKLESNSTHLRQSSTALTSDPKCKFWVSPNTHISVWSTTNSSRASHNLFRFDNSRMTHRIQISVTFIIATLL